MPIPLTTAMRFTASVSRDLDAEQAGSAVARDVKRGLDGSSADLACLFFSAQYVDQAEELIAVIRHELQPGLLIGCTGEGVIGGGEEIESAAAVTLWAAHLPDVALTPIRLSGERDEYGVSVTGWPSSLDLIPDRPSFLMFADPFTTPMDDVLTLLSDRCPGAPAIGGLAGGGRDQGENRVVLNGDVYDNGLVGVGIIGPVTIRAVISQGCRPIGERYVVTKAAHNVIQELGGTSALERLQALFDSLAGEEQRLAQQALHVGIVIDEQRNHFERGDFLVRNLIGADRQSGSLAIGDVIREGQTIQFHVRDARSATEDLHLMLAGDRVRCKQQPLGALLFSCCGRGRGLFGRPHHDVGIVRERVGDIPIAGFFAQGEIGPVGNQNFLHGYTASIALFSEAER